jgi:hypothetical protein
LGEFFIRARVGGVGLPLGDPTQLVWERLRVDLANGLGPLYYNKEVFFFFRLFFTCVN